MLMQDKIIKIFVNLVGNIPQMEVIINFLKINNQLIFFTFDLLDIILRLSCLSTILGHQNYL